MKVHELKTLKIHFDSVFKGLKKFEIRNDDRNYRAGDILHLKEYDDEKKQYTGREILADVTYIFAGGQYGLKDGFCIMSIVEFRKIDKSDLPF